MGTSNALARRAAVAASGSRSPFSMRQIADAVAPISSMPGVWVGRLAMQPNGRREGLHRQTLTCTLAQRAQKGKGRCTRATTCRCAIRRANGG